MYIITNPILFCVIISGKFALDLEKPKMSIRNFLSNQFLS